MTEVTKAWHSCSAFIIRAKLTIMDMHQITTGIFREHFPELLKDQSSTQKTMVQILTNDTTASMLNSVTGPQPQTPMTTSRQAESIRL
jgi:hypothetical protein